MKLSFDLKKVTVTEFGVGRDNSKGSTFVAIPVDKDVQAALGEMAQVTWEAMREYEDGPVQYEPSEKHGSVEYLTLPLTDNMASPYRLLQDATSLPIVSNALDDPTDVFCYFARFTDKKGRRLTAVRRATQFKGILKNRLIRLVSNALKLIEDDVFKLDNDFDVLINAAEIHILRPSGFEFTGKLQRAILDAMPGNALAVSKALPFMQMEGIEAYAGNHPRAARYLASINAQPDVNSIDKTLLRRACRDNGVELLVSKGKLAVVDGHELGFLEVLDRRRYELELVKGAPERFKAASRRKVDG